MDNDIIQSIVDNVFSVLPLLKKKLLKPDKYDEDNDLSPSHLQVLFFLDDVGRVPISEIGRNLNISKPNMTPLIKKLISKKLVKKVRDEQDKRYANVEITSEGKNFLNEHRSFMAHNLEVKLSRLNQDDLEKLSKSLNDLREVISKLD